MGKVKELVLELREGRLVLILGRLDISRIKK
jgi:hypothetical protein